MGFRAWLSWVSGAESPMGKGSPVAPDRTCVLEPGLLHQMYDSTPGAELFGIEDVVR